MRIKSLQLMFLLLFSQVPFLRAQEPVTLEQCQQWARENHPVLKQSGLYQQILDLKNQSNAASLLPQLTLNGRLTNHM